MTTTVFYSPKGGQGCTVTACAYALRLAAESAGDVLLIDWGGDAHAALGLPSPDGNYSADVATHLSILVEPGVFSADDFQHTVIDAGTALTEPIPDATHVMVIEPCYLALRRAVAMSFKPDMIAVLEPPTRVLTRADVERAVGAPTAAIAQGPAIARAVDAGLLVTRLPHTLREDVDRLGELCRTTA